MTYIAVSLRREVQERANRGCEYCLLHEEDAYFSHEPDHVIAEKHDGETNRDNLAWSCFDCNRFKGSDIASIDRTTDSLVPLFHPRNHLWQDHFEVCNAVIQPLTAIGRATEKILKLNLPDRVEVRRVLTTLKRYPHA